MAESSDRPRFKPLVEDAQARILFLMQYTYLKQESEKELEHEVEKIRKRIGASDQLVFDAAMESAKGDELIVVTSLVDSFGDSYGDDICKITTWGLTWVDSWSAERYDEIKSAVMSADENSHAAPASDRFVSLDHNSEPCQQAVGAIDAAIEAVRADNEYGERDNEDRDQRVAELKAGAELLKSNRVEPSKIEAVLIKTLAYLTGIGVAVTECAAAIEAVKALFGS